MQHSSSCSNNGPVLPLNNPILLGVVRNCKLSANAMLITEFHELIGGIITPIVGPQDLDLLPCLVLHKSFELLEPIEDLTLGLQEKDLGLPGVIINKCDIVLMPTQRYCRDRTTNIRMSQLKNASYLVLTTRE